MIRSRSEGSARPEPDSMPSPDPSHPQEEAQKSQAVLLSIGVISMFGSWGLHDFLQEAVFKQPGFHYGLMMAFWLQGVSVSFAGIGRILKRLRQYQKPQVTSSERRAQVDAESGAGEESAGSMRYLLAHYVGLACAIAAANGLSTSALNHVNMPAKVLFKSSKLIPVMIIGALIKNEVFGISDYLLAAVISTGLAVFSSADLRSSAQFDIVGFVMLAGAVTADAVAPNMQQRLLQKLNQEKEDVIFHTNWMSSVFTISAMLLGGEFVPAYTHLIANPTTCFLLFVQSVAGYMGISAFLWCIGTFGSRTTCIIASTRKMLTICISYSWFKKPFNLMHLLGIMMVMGAVTASGMLKRKPSPTRSTESPRRSKPVDQSV
eukprot:Hpha_TRINITY_DN18751_c0_g1::TRINITY_DN18751_c0_g1_i1::g.47418::m.47418/K15277/SLC35B3, PAPST2; solute carrier family 35 (adenosine 3'-phospho 5'-phosphosulfate transporter), member B3